MENRLLKIRDLFQKIPILDPSREWHHSTVRENVWIASRPDITTKTERTFVPIVLHEATKEHPAQIEKISKDEVVGTFTNISFSGAITGIQKTNCIKRIDNLIDEIKKAKMRANMENVPDVRIGEILSNYIFQPLKSD